MPKIIFNKQVVQCEHGENLRKVLLRNGLSPYNGLARYINCRGLGTCGTCALQIEGSVSPLTLKENWRLQFPPHERNDGLRLACQCTVLDDLTLTKWRGLWGHKRPLAETS